MTAHSPKGKERASGLSSSRPLGKGEARGAMDVDGAMLASQAHLPWVEKYRPTALADVISHGDIISTCTSETSSPPHTLTTPRYSASLCGRGQASASALLRTTRDGKDEHGLFIGKRDLWTGASLHGPRAERQRRARHWRGSRTNQELCCHAHTLPVSFGRGNRQFQADHSGRV